MNWPLKSIHLEVLRIRLFLSSLHARYGLQRDIDDTTGLPFGSTTYKTDAQTFYTDETLEITIPYEAMKRMMEVKNLKLLLGNREMIFRDEQLRDIRDLGAAMSPS